MKTFSLHIVLLVEGFLLITLYSQAQTVERRIKSKPDTLTFADRISVRTNAFDWFLLTPNIGFEFEIGNKEYNHWAAGVNFRYNWQTKHTFNPAQVYNIAEGQFNVRYYWHQRHYYTNDERKAFYRRTFFWQRHKAAKKKVSTEEEKLNADKKKKRKTNMRPLAAYSPFVSDCDSLEGIKHPNATYYLGGYTSYTKYSIMLLSNKGYQGTAVSAGVSLGLIKPVYQFANGNSVDLDLGINAGLSFTQNDHYTLDRESNCYPLVKKNSWHIVPFPVVTEARIALIYRFGHRPVTQKYRWRYDVEAKRKHMLDSIFDAKGVKWREDSTMRVFMMGMDEHFEYIYNKVYPDTLRSIQKRIAKKEEEKRAREAQLKATERRKEGEE